MAIASVGGDQQQQQNKSVHARMSVFVFKVSVHINYYVVLCSGWTTDGAYGQYNIEGPIRSEIDKRRRSGVKCNVTERSRSAIYYSLMAPYVGLVVAESVGHPDHWSKRLQLNWGGYSLSW